MAKRTIEDMVRDRYEDEDLHGPILEDIARLKHADRIISGELVLPSPQDARIWLDRKEGRLTMSPTEKQQADKISDMERQIQELRDMLHGKDKPQQEENPPTPDHNVDGGKQ